jgi:thiopeptide-type bacteriocin biosynthesis protein
MKSAFEFGQYMLLRLPLHQQEDVLFDPQPNGDPSGEDPYTIESLTAFLRRSRPPLFDEAIEISSPALARTLRRIYAGRRLKPGEVRRASEALSRYQVRAATRCTPFGLLAGVGVMRFGEETKVVNSGNHRRWVTVDQGWLIAAAREMERDPLVRGRLRVQANALASERGGRLALPFALDMWSPAKPRSVRATPVVKLAIQAAAEPIAYAELLGVLTARFPGAPTTSLANLLGQLIELDLLLTELRPPDDHPDPLAHVLGLVPEAPGLQRISRAVAAYAATRLPDAAPDEARKLADMISAGTVHDGAQEPGVPLAVDVGLDLEGTLHRAVGEEIAAAAEVLWRLGPDMTGARPALNNYHQEFVERYGIGQAVPLTELLDAERGLGSPAEYRFPRSARASSGLERDRDRDRILSELALEALQRGGEVVLDAPTIRRLARQDKPLPPRGLDLHAELVAAHPAAVDEGEFQVILTPWPGSLTAGATFGRFAYLLGGAPLLQEVAQRPRPDTLAAHLSCGVHLARHRNVTRTAHWLPNRVTVGAFGGERPGDIPIADLAVAADGQRLRMFCVSRGLELDACAHTMLNPATTSPNEARLLSDVSLMASGAFSGWRWGEAENLPVLPRVRYQRTVLAPASWRCTGPVLDRSLSWPGWQEALEAWRRRWSVPERIRLGTGDQQLRLDLRRQWHRWLLRAEINGAAHGAPVVLQEDPAALGGAGWLGDPGVIAELVVALRSTDAPLPGVPMPPVRQPPVLHLPGGQWLYAKLYTAAGRQRALMAGAVRELVSGLSGEVDEWFAVRYADPEPHLRLRLRGDQRSLWGTVLTRVNRWVGELIEAGLVRRMDLSGYEPETERYGGLDLLPLAHRVFHADSVLTSALLADDLDRQPPGPWLTAAVSAVDIISALFSATPQDPHTWMLRQIRKSQSHHARVRPHLPQLLRAAAGADYEVPGPPPQLFAGGNLSELWRARTRSLRAYGEALHEVCAGRGSERLDRAALSLIHMHHNRLIGTDRESEETMLAAARSIAQSRHGRQAAGL